MKEVREFEEKDRRSRVRICITSNHRYGSSIMKTIEVKNKIHHQSTDTAQLSKQASLILSVVVGQTIKAPLDTFYS